MQLLTLALAASSLLGAVQATGVAAVHNKCPGKMYLWSVGDVASHTVGPLTKNAIFNETFRVRTSGGVSVKIAGTDTFGDNSTQFEYTVDPVGTADRKVWYDLSNINGNALPTVDYKLEPSDPDCPTVYCAAGASKCDAVYNHPKDDESTHACSADADLVFTLCPDKKNSATGDGDPTSGSGSSGSGGSSSSAPASTGPVNLVNSGTGVLGESGPPPVAAAAAAAKKVATPSGGSDADDTITWLTATFPSSKREEHAAAHAHSHQHSHQRLRRSRVFRADEE